jgi:hypothetical protein
MIYDLNSLNSAAKIISDISPDLGIILILGNQVCPVDIPNLYQFRSKIYKKEGRRVADAELEERYFTYLESARLETSCALPNRNILCLMRLVRKGLVKAVITTNYDCYIRSAFLRYGGPYQCILNPCIPSQDKYTCWDCNGYWSSSRRAKKSIPLWKIHGDLGFVRMTECGHIFALPNFVIRRAHRLPNGNRDICHFSVFKEDGSKYPDPSLTDEHPTNSYQHHIDYLISRDNHFMKESSAAKQQLLSHARAGGAIFIIGLSCSPKFKEDLVPILSRANKVAPIVYILASEERIESSNNELLFEFERQGRSFELINEVTSDRTIHDAVEEVLIRAGEKNIDAEWHTWQNEGKWWTETL